MATNKFGQRFMLSLTGMAVAGMMLVASPAKTVADEQWPDKPISIMIPSGPGSSMDRLIRGVHQFYSTELGEVPIVLKNRPGGNYTVGVEAAWRAEPDGNTLLMFLEPMFSGVLKRKEKLFTNNVDDFAFIGGLNVDPAGLMVHKDGKYQTFKEAVAALKEGKKVTLGATPGGASLIGMYAASEKAKMDKPTVVFYAGGGKLRVDALGGHLDMNTAFHDGFMPLHKDGTVKFVAFFSDKRLPDLPDIPTVNEVLKEFGAGDNAVPALNGVRFLAVNKKVKENHPERYKKLVAALERVANDKGFKKWAKRSGFETTWVPPETLEKWSKQTYDLISAYPETLTGN